MNEPKDIGQKMMEVAMQSSAMTKDQMRLKKREMDEERKKGFKPIPQANAKKWLDRIDRSKKIAKPFKEDSERFMRNYQGDYSTRPGKKRNFDAISVNIIYNIVETQTPAIFSGPPLIRVKAKPKVGEQLSEAEERARNMELTLNYWLKELDAEGELKDAFFDWFFGHAVTEVGWEADIEEREVKTLGPNGEEITGTEVLVLKDQPFIMRRDPWTVGFDPDARRRKDSSFIWVEEVLKYNDFIASKRFTEYAKKKIKPQVKPVDAGEERGGSRENDKSEKEWVQIFTIWDRDTRKKFVVAKGCEKFLNTDDPEGEDWPLDIEYKNDPYPFCILDAKKDRQSPYTWSEFRAYEPQIVERNRIRSAMQIHVKRTLPKYIYTQAFGGRDKVNKLMQARSDEAVQVDNLEAFKALENANIPKDLWEFESLAKNDLEAVSASAEYQGQSIADTATEASIIQGKSEVRKSFKSRTWEQYIVEVAAKLAQVLQANMSQAVAVEIAGPNGIEWIGVDKKQIQGEFYYDIEPGIMEHKNEALRKQQLLKFVEITNGDPNVNRRALIAKVAREFDLSAEDLIVPEDQMPGGEPPKPTLTFKAIDPAQLLTLPGGQEEFAALLRAAFSQNGVEVPEEAPPAPPMEGEAPPMEGAQELPPPSSGKDPLNASPNGNPALPPVEGNLSEGLGSL